ncbi:hypothetical protein NQ315_006284 [Exocentrus adspersus]|uniref:Uncharacterized protein n=1 Tax=Exocentrus adspersus TaxID=1586481 RepID=A0AAV8W084_9CUCU|nr:hypothetical protein NQ315_006284 [Exocentrus adspersus]
MNPVYDFIQRNRVLAKIEKAHCSKARNLNLDDFDLETFPEILLNCHDLCSLRLSHNRIMDLPSDMFHLKNLQHVSLAYNNLDKFPESLKHLSQIVTLNISHNPIKDLTKVIGCLTTLEILWCNSCCLISLPEEIGNLTNLETFGARRNKITKLPNTMSNLKSLRWLTLEDNNLHSVPQDFCKVPLVHINFNRNNFNTIPPQLAKIKSLKYLHLQSNEFFSLPEPTIFSMPHTKINLMHNPLQLTDNKIFTNVIITNTEHEILDLLGHDSDSSSDNWDTSMVSSDLNYSATESESEDEEVLTDIPRLSKYLLNF